MEQAIPAIFGAGAMVIVGLLGVVGTSIRKNGTADFGVAAEARLGDKIDNQHDTLKEMLGVQRDTKEAIVKVATILERNGRR